MQCKLIFLLGCTLFICIFLPFNTVTAQALPPNVRVVAQDFVWAENLHFDRRGELYATELTKGIVYHISPESGGVFSKVSWLADSSISALLGLASDPENDQMWTTGHTGSANFILSFSTLQTNSFEMLCKDLPKKGNGLGFDESSRQLFVTSEGDFLPGDGSVYKVNITTGAWVELKIKPSSFDGTQKLSHRTLLQNQPLLAKLAARLSVEELQQWKDAVWSMIEGRSLMPHSVSDLWGADGLWIDQPSSTLYVGELLTGNVWAWSIPDSSPVGIVASIHGLTTLPLLDDFTLSLDGTQLIGCNWWNSSIDVTDMGHTTPYNAHPILSGLNNPTSARWGPPNSTGSPWAADSLFVTEGKSTILEHECRVLEIQHASCLRANGCK